MANGAMDLTGWHIMTQEEMDEHDERARQRDAEELARWPLSQRRNRCLNCGAFMPKSTRQNTRCKVCGESFASLQ